MGKKVKSKGRNPRKVNQRPSNSSSPQADVPDNPEAGIGSEEVDVGEACEHYDKSNAELNRILSGIKSIPFDSRCEDCRDDVGGRKGGKGKGKVGKKKGGSSSSSKSDSKAEVVWVCLNCGHLSCGGGVNELIPYGHARRHSKQEQHPLVVRLDKPLVSWCFTCNSKIPIEMPEVLEEEVKSGNGIGGGSTENGSKMDDLSESVGVDLGKGYAVRGLMNLGNTCFFNSVMQNLFATYPLREYFLNLNETAGPLTMSLKKLFRETSASMETNNRSIVNPKNLFGCICSKAPQFKGYQQQDSHELLRYLLDGLSTEELSLIKSKGTSRQDKIAPTIVDTLFGGLLSSTVCCLECRHISVVHEPFLDLSLPVPAKKVPAKKTSVGSQKKGKYQPKDVPKGRRSRDRGTVKLSHLNQRKTNVTNVPSKYSNDDKTQSVPSQSDSGGSSCSAACNQEKVVPLPEEPDTSWLDFIDLSAAPADVCEEHEHKENLADEDQEDSASKGSKCGETVPCKTDLQFGPHLPTDVQLEEQTAPFESYTETSGAAENVMETAVESQKSEETETNGKLANEAESSSSVAFEQAESDFDGIGDLFAEPEATSDVGTEAAATEERESSWLTGGSSESNQEEVDNMNAPVSVNSCLAYFTKAELLSDEHAWHCENCSKMLKQQKLKRRDIIQPKLEQDEMHKALRPEMETVKIISKPTTLILEDNFVEVSENKIFENGKSSDPPQNLVLDVKSHGGSNIDSSPNKTCSNGVGLEINDSQNSFLENCCQVPNRDEHATTSEASQYYSCSSNVDMSESRYDSGYLDGNSCSKDEINGDGCEAQSLALYPNEGKKGKNHSKPHENGTCVDVQQGKKKCKKLSNRKQKSEENESEDEKVKRDATKRILINKVPPVLTIHLKRFSQDTRGRLNKLNGHVCFEEVLDLMPYVDPSIHNNEKYLFRLIGVVEHSGSMRGGHYIAYVRGERGRRKSENNSGSNTWYYASDSHTHEVSLTEVLQSEAYILFYERMQN